MAPVYLNPPSSAFPLVELKEEQQLPLSLSPHQASTSLSGPTFFSTTDQDQRERMLWGTNQHDQAEVDEYNLSLGRSCDHKKVFPSSSFQSAVVNHDDTSNAHKVSSSCKRADEAERSGTDGSLKWMQKLMLNSNSSAEADHKPVKFTLKFQGQHKEVSSSSKNNNNNNSSIRVCSDCNTTSTPLWRSGPRGPKSLCNACGIRQRKARRAMAAAAAAANGTAIAIEASSSSCAKSNKVYNKEKKSRTSHVSQCKKLCTLPQDQSPKKQLCNFKNLAPSLSKNSALQLGVLPQDVEEAAILLMELSCGFIYT